MAKQAVDGKPFENYMFILEPHPFNEEILMSADYDGKVACLASCLIYLA